MQIIATANAAGGGRVARERFVRRDRIRQKRRQRRSGAARARFPRGGEKRKQPWSQTRQMRGAHEKRAVAGGGHRNRPPRNARRGERRAGATSENPRAAGGGRSLGRLASAPHDIVIGAPQGLGDGRADNAAADDGDFFRRRIRVHITPRARISRDARAQAPRGFAFAAIEALVPGRARARPPPATARARRKRLPPFRGRGRESRRARRRRAQHRARARSRLLPRPIRRKANRAAGAAASARIKGSVILPSAKSRPMLLPASDSSPSKSRQSSIN